ncbi:Succinate dehydrogenase cytochrome b560 subunit [Trichinella spiralis]|uniref:Succinate dehydrogenase cytochrome b560 subunit, mitochondrial n=2 Tax=Trichinella spiralis TaxID=6334 RepID=E5SFH8_TRISP|nr:putative succinate dehydrogenase, cytochrome b556 subunit [Trichinella spiralis]KRY33171.1 Succinate dehydrogenase cytochrome b560 subunit, mitochondrial [Trichinella spiralis]
MSFPMFVRIGAMQNCTRVVPLRFLGKQLGSASLKTFAPLRSNVKTPIQSWGWDWLNHQKNLKRPLSPHLTVYKPMLTWMVSGLHRISGVVMGTTVALFSIGLMAAPFDFTTLIEYIRNLHLPVVFVYAVKYAIAWPLTFHTLNGVRFLAFDLAKGTDIPTVYKTGWTVVGLSLVIAAILTFWRDH